MSRTGSALSLVVLLLFVSCHSGDPPRSPKIEWAAEFLVANGTEPVLSPDNSMFLFLREGQGLILWRDDQETLVSPSGSTARPDYVWSTSGENLFAFSVPGAPGGQVSGVYIGDQSGQIARIWDRGSHPAYHAADGTVLCAGPVESESESGVWKITLPNLERVRIVTHGTSPKFGYDAAFALYQTQNASSNGDSLHAIRLSDSQVVLTAAHVGDYVSSFFTDIVLLEIVADDAGTVIPPAVFRAAIFNPHLFELLAQPATNVSLLAGGNVLFNQANNEQLGPLVLLQAEEEVLVSDTLFQATANSASVIVAAGHSGITRLTSL